MAEEPIEPPIDNQGEHHEAGVDPTQLGDAALGQPGFQEEDSSHRIEDKEVAFGQAQAELSTRFLESMISNVESSSMPVSEKDEITKRLKEQADELSSKARTEYEAAQARYNKALDTLMGRVTAVGKREMGREDAVSILTLRYPTGSRTDGLPATDETVSGLTGHQLEKLEEAMHTMLGTKHPEASDFNFQPGRHGIGESTLVLTSPLGLKLIIRAQGYNGLHEERDTGKLVERIEYYLTSNKESDATDIIGN